MYLQLGSERLVSRVAGEKRRDTHKEADKQGWKGRLDENIKVKDCETEFLQKGRVCCVPGRAGRTFFNPPRKY